MSLLRLGFLASGRGTNMQVIIDACRSGTLPAEPRVIISNNSQSGALKQAREQRIPHAHLSSHTLPTPDVLDHVICETLQRHEVQIVCLAGYMKLLGAKTLAAFRGHILNVHPALLPKFGGKGFYGIHVHEAVLAAGEIQSGVSVHVVDEVYDHGPVIAQAHVSVLPEDTPESLAARVLEQEHRLYPETLQRIAIGEIDLGRLLVPSIENEE
ncbi:MAG: phosphoribosylglycinamide formyltransferase [Candidatus Latescibacterota bacterium]|nr:phosphoribosylglycinamide formyltransferase [Candidatus Latescibacterota bacterium]